MNAYLIENRPNKLRTCKNAQSVTFHTYHTPGIIDLGSVRNNIPNYQTALVVIDESIDLPSPGIYKVKIKVENKWHVGIAVLSQSSTTDTSYTRVMKVFIKDRIDKPKNNNVSVAWCLNMKNY